MVCGAVSSGMEVIDFDFAETFQPWRSLIEPKVFSKLSIVKTPGGYHAIYRCNELCGNRRLACWEPPASLSQKMYGHRDGTGFRAIGKGVRIETRGEGGYVVAAGTPCSTHLTGLPYVHAFGPLITQLQFVTPEERREMWLAARHFDCGADEGSVRVRKMKQELKAKHFAGHNDSSVDEPWDWFDKHGDVVGLLTKHNYESTDAIRWRRPGKADGGFSAVLQESPDSHILIFTSFSTSDGKLGPRGGESHRSSGPFAMLTLLEFNGDRKEAARYVRKELMK